MTAVIGQEPRAMPKTPDAAIRTEDLRKTYKSNRGDVEAVRGISLNVPHGEFFGLLGPNGAGKSTTIGMLTTLVRPTGGRAWVAGHDVTGSLTNSPPERPAFSAAGIPLWCKVLLLLVADQSGAPAPDVASGGPPPT